MNKFTAFATGLAFTSLKTLPALAYVIVVGTPHQAPAPSLASDIPAFIMVGGILLGSKLYPRLRGHDA